MIFLNRFCPLSKISVPPTAISRVVFRLISVQESRIEKQKHSEKMGGGISETNSDYTCTESKRKINNVS